MWNIYGGKFRQNSYWLKVVRKMFHYQCLAMSYYTSVILCIIRLLKQGPSGPFPTVQLFIMINGWPKEIKDPITMYWQRQKQGPNEWILQGWKCSIQTCCLHHRKVKGTWLHWRCWQSYYNQAMSFRNQRHKNP